MARPRSRGVRCVVRRRGEILFVRHTYGDRGWMLPGGRMRRTETPDAAAAREMSHELGVEVTGWRELGSFHSRRQHKRDTTFYLEAELAGGSLRLDAGQIADAAWFTLDGLPLDASPAVGEALDQGLLSAG